MHLCLWLLPWVPLHSPVGGQGAEAAMEEGTAWPEWCWRPWSAGGHGQGGQHPGVVEAMVSCGFQNTP